MVYLLAPVDMILVAAVGQGVYSIDIKAITTIQRVCSLIAFLKVWSSEPWFMRLKYIFIMIVLFLPAAPFFFFFFCCADVFIHNAEVVDITNSLEKTLMLGKIEGKW